MVFVTLETTVVPPSFVSRPLVGLRAVHIYNYLFFFLIVATLLLLNYIPMAYKMIENESKREGEQKRHNYMNCRTQKL